MSAKFYDSFKVPENNVIPVEDVYERFSRELAFKLACNAENEQCLTDTYIQNHLFADHDRKIPKGMENVIFCSGFRGTNKAGEWTEMWKKMQSTSDATFKSQAINGLGCSDDKAVLKDYLESTLGAGNSVNYTQAERRAVVSAVLISYSGLDAVINFFKDFELDILRSFGYGTLEAMVTVPARTVKTREQQATFMDYLLTLTHLDAETYRRIATIVGNNFVAQQQPTNANLMDIIGKILGGLNQETTTEVLTPPTPTQTNPTPTNPTPTNPTPPPPTQTNPTTTVSTTTNPTSTNPTSTISDQPTSSSTPLTTESTTTTLGASSLGIKMITLIMCFFVAMFLKN